MYAKAALHLHINLDPVDKITYSGFEAIQKAADLDFKILSFTCHDKLIDLNLFQGYAQQKGILLIPGIEKTIQKKHVLILNATKSAEKITTFIELEEYKRTHPNCFIIAPHPFFFFGNCLGPLLEKHIDLFDAIEYNYFYHKFFNPNNKAVLLSQKYQKPLIGTSDIHLLEHFDPTYTKIKIETLDIPSVFEALKKNQLEIITKSFSIFSLIKILYKMMFIGSKKNALQFQKPFFRKGLPKSQTKPADSSLS
jgi:predicted metal-dependent phosphoesterase TrpH